MSLEDCKILGEDKLKQVYVLPKKILWSGSGVKNARQLLSNRLEQIYVGVPKVTTLSNQDGKKGAILLDFGTELAGGLEVLVAERVSNAKGVKVRVRFGESVSEAMMPVGEKNATNDHSPRDITVLFTALSQQIVADTGYRFVYLELEDEEAMMDIVAVRGVFRYRDIPYLGSFSCDDKVLNQIYEVCAYTVHLNMRNLLWDGIKRDRLVWVGDMHPEMLAIRSVFGGNAIVEDCLRYVARTNPLPKWPNHMTTYGFWYILILWDWYWYQGKKELVLELKEYWKGLLEQMVALVHREGETLREEEFQMGFFLDWPTRDTEEAKAGVYALFRLSLCAAAKLCELTEEDSLMKLCMENAALLERKELPHHGRKQIAAMLYMAELLEKEEAGKILVADGGHGMSTFMSYYILSATADSAGMESAQTMLKEYYGAMLDAGATTFWEDFDLEWVREGARIDKLLEPGEYDIHGDNGRFCYQGMRHSLCHGWSAGPAAFLAEKVLGIGILEAGCKKLTVKPNLGHLEWVKGTYPTPYGVVEVSVRRKGEEVITKVSAPPEVEICK